MDKNFQDKELFCICGKMFIWTAGEQVFMDNLLQKGMLDRENPDGTKSPGEVVEPKRCKDCRMKKKQQMGQ